MGAPLPPADSIKYDFVFAASCTQLGETAFKEIWASASTRSFQEVVENLGKLTILLLCIDTDQCNCVGLQKNEAEDLRLVQS